MVGYFWVADERLGFRNRPNALFVAERIAGSPLITTDSSGLRNGIGWSPAAGRPVIVILGDSNVFGAEVNDDETIPSQIARLLAPAFEVRVLNGGVRGFNTLQTRRLLAEVLERFARVELVVYVFSQNDLFENLNPIVYHPVVAPVASWDVATGSLRYLEPELAVPPGQPLLTLVDAPAPATRASARQKLTNAIRAHSAFAHEALSRLRTIIGRPRVTRTVVTLEGGSVGPLLDQQMWEEQLTWARGRDAASVLAALVAEMGSEADRHGAGFLVTEHADFFWGDGGPTPEIVAAADAAGVSFVDVAPAFSDDPQSYLARRAGHLDLHYSVQGTTTFAQALTPAIEQLLSARGLGAPAPGSQPLE